MKKYLIIFIIIVSLVVVYCKLNIPTTTNHYDYNHNDKLIIAQKKMTNMFYEFDRICTKYNLRYWCSGGTFVGVIRHGGWVPWDGDVDVGMIYEEYLEFKKYAEDELPSTMAVIENGTLGLSKIRDLYSQYTDYTIHKDVHHGLQLDIFLYNLDYDKKILTSIGNLEVYKEDKYNYDDVFPLVRAPFEDIQVNIFNQYVKLSKYIFGDYPPAMPPIDKRITHEGNIEPETPAPYYFVKYKDLYNKKNNK